MRKAAWIGGGLLAALIALLVIVPAFIDVGTFKRTYLPLVEESLHRSVDVGEVRLSLIPTPSIRVSKLTVSDGPAFSSSPFFSAAQLQLRLKLWPLLLGRFEITEFVLDKPVMNLSKQPDGGFKYADNGGKKTTTARQEIKKKPSAQKSQDPAAVPFILPNRMRIRDGQLNFETGGQKPVKVNGIDLSLQDFSSGQPFPYRASFDYPGLKTISVEGQLRYEAEQSTLTLKNNELKAQDLVLPLEGSIVSLSTVPRVHLTASSEQLDAKPVFQILSVLGIAPSDTAVSGLMGLRLTVTGPSHSLLTELRGRFKDVRVDGKRALKGNLTGDVFIKLPLGGHSPLTQRLQGDGKLTARDGELTNVNLIKKVQQATGFIGLSQNERREATTFKTLEGEFTIKGGVAEFTRIHLINPQMEVNGAGTMTLNRPTLDMGIEAALSNQVSARAASGRTISFFKDNQGRIVVPLKVSGSVENPSVSLDSQKMIQRGMPGSTEKRMGAFFRQLFQRR
ncbi:MAG: AsmA family protein [Candidatus Binatia bacterium]